MSAMSPHRKLFVIAWFYIFWVLLLLPACKIFYNNKEQIQLTEQSLLGQMTQLAKTQTQLAGQLEEIETPTPIQISPIENPPVISPTQTPSPIPVAAHEDVNLIIERNLKSAKILLFEDMSASRHQRYVKEALDREDYFYLDVGSATGWFKSQLLSTVQWDLIIAAAEARREFGGEFFEYLDKQVEQGASVIVEYWDWDLAPNGKSQALLDRCGVSYQSDWFEPDLRVFFWLDPKNPVFDEPNTIPANLRNAPTLWRGDLGDLFKLNQPSNSQESSTVLLAGTHPQYPNDHAILVSCVDGRVILQGFSSHEYAKEDMIAIWQNYIYQSLKNRFKISRPYIPTESTTYPYNPATPSVPAAINQNAACGDFLEARVSEQPYRQQDLFEHHAKGEFLVLSLEMHNNGSLPQFIYDQDYFVEGYLEDKLVIYQPDKAATGYLYIQKAGNLYQDLLLPGASFRTHLAFDIHPDASDLVLVVRPGAEFQHQSCEVRISLDLDYTQE